MTQERINELKAQVEGWNAYDYRAFLKNNHGLTDEDCLMLLWHCANVGESIYIVEYGEEDTDTFVVTDMIFEDNNIRIFVHNRYGDREYTFEELDRELFFFEEREWWSTAVEVCVSEW